MSKTMAFTVFCMENYKQAKRLSGRQVDTLFSQYDVYDYLREFYDVLHTTGHQYLVRDIDLYIDARRTA